MLRDRRTSELYTKKNETVAIHLLYDIQRHIKLLNFAGHCQWTKNTKRSTTQNEQSISRTATRKTTNSYIILPHDFRGLKNQTGRPRDSPHTETAWSKLAGSLHVIEQNCIEESAGQYPFMGSVALPCRHHPPRLDAIIMNARFTVEPDNLAPKKKTKTRWKEDQKVGNEKRKKTQRKRDKERVEQ